MIVAALLIAFTLPSAAYAQDASFLAATTFRIGGLPGDVAVARFGHDQHLDAVVTNNDVGTITVLHGTGTGTY